MNTLGWKQIILALVSLSLVSAMLIAIGVMPGDALLELAHGSMGSKNGWTETLKQTTPLLIAGLAVYIALKAGLFNIGAEGQLLMGAMCSTVVALNVQGVLGTILAIIVGTAAGALWSLPAALIKAYRNGHEVITTIMLNNVASAVAIGLLAGPLKNPRGLGLTTSTVDQSTWLPTLVSSPPLRINIALPFAVLLVAVVALWIRRSVAGYELCAVGANARAAATAGVDVKRVTVRAMAVSGALSGLAGAVQVLAYEHSFYDGFSSGLGFDALGVALLAGGSPWGAVPSALLFGALNKGSTSLQSLGVPKGLGGVLLGVLIIVFAAYRYRRVRSHD